MPSQEEYYIQVLPKYGVLGFLPVFFYYCSIATLFSDKKSWSLAALAYDTLIPKDYLEVR